MTERWEDARYDPEEERMAEVVRLDRKREQGSDPSIYLGPIDKCANCGVLPKELLPGFWVCACGLPVPELC